MSALRRIVSGSFLTLMGAMLILPACSASSETGAQNHSPAATKPIEPRRADIELAVQSIFTRWTNVKFSKVPRHPGLTMRFAHDARALEALAEYTEAVDLSHPNRRRALQDGRRNVDVRCCGGFKGKGGLLAS